MRGGSILTGMFSDTELILFTFTSPCGKFQGGHIGMVTAWCADLIVLSAGMRIG
jgi:hypothetical protein